MRPVWPKPIEAANSRAGGVIHQVRDVRRGMRLRATGRHRWHQTPMLGVETMSLVQHEILGKWRLMVLTWAAASALALNLLSQFSESGFSKI